jgi:hypothetical protein
MREKMSEWVLHCAVDRHLVRRSQPTRDTALEDACSQLLQGHAVNRIIGPNEIINAHKIKGMVRKASSTPRKSPACLGPGGAEVMGVGSPCYLFPRAFASQTPMSELGLQCRPTEIGGTREAQSRCLGGPPSSLPPAPTTGAGTPSLTSGCGGVFLWVER